MTDDGSEKDILDFVYKNYGYHGYWGNYRAYLKEEEFERVKNLKKSVLEYSTETNADIAEANGSMMHLFERCKTIEERKEQIENVSLEDVNEFARVIANEEMFNVVAVGKKLNKEDLKQF